MVPKVAKRGHSFKGAGLYYLHDKANEQGQKVSTSDRVAWTHAHNLPTNDPERAMRFMAYTAMNAEQAKNNAGVSKAGRKSTAGAVYSFSLAWHTEQNPEKDHMLNVSMDVLERLGLKDNHQAVIVAHQETDHDHVHVICNLVNMETGKTASMSNDRLILSKWAEEYELEHGVYCEQRIKNNEERKRLVGEKEKRKEQQQAYKNGEVKEKPETGIVKHREKKIDKVQIQNLYQQSDSAKAFQAALRDNGYELARGDRRGLVLVDDTTGKVHSLSRQMKGLWEKDKTTGKWIGGLEERFEDFDAKALLPVKDVVDSIMYVDRDKQNQEQQDRIEQAAIEQEKLKIQKEKEQKKQDWLKEKNKQRKASKKSLQSEWDLSEEGASKKQTPEKKIPANDHLVRLDKLRAWEEKAQQRRFLLEKKMSDFYKRDEHEAKIKDLEKRLSKLDTAFGRKTKKYKELQEAINNERLTLQNIDQRIDEQTNKLENELKESKPLFDKEVNDPKPKPDLNPQKQSRLNKAKEAFNKRQNQLKRGDSSKDLEL